jgi:predicted porin
MKKNLAGTIACLAWALLAQPVGAEEMDAVSLYGYVNGDVESVKATGKGGGLPQMERVSNNLTVLGVKGTESLGHGVKAMFQLETSFPIDVAATSFGGRDAGVGLIAPAGTVIAGMWMTPFKYGTNFLVDPFNNNTIAAANGIMGNGFALGANAQAPQSFDRRQMNSVQYWSPVVGGFSARLMYGANEEKGAGRNPRMASELLTYVQGPVYAAFACEQHDDYFAAGTRDTACRIAGIYTVVQGLKLRASYERLRFEPSVATNVQRNAWMLGMTYEAAPHVLRATYVHALASTGNAKVAVGGIGAPGGDTAAKQLTLSYAYAFSRRTELYIFYVRIDNGLDAIYNLSTNPLAGLTAGQDPQGYGVGLRIFY